MEGKRKRTNERAIGTQTTVRSLFCKVLIKNDSNESHKFDVTVIALKTLNELYSKALGKEQTLNTTLRLQVWSEKMTKRN